MGIEHPDDLVADLEQALGWTVVEPLPSHGRPSGRSVKEPSRVYVGVMRSSTRTVEGAASGRLGELYIAHAPAALRFAYYLSGDREQARDLVQDAFVRVAGRYAHLRQPDVFETYLRRTIFNLHASRLRRLRLERAYLAREARRAEPAPVDADPAERDEVWGAILELPARQRAAIVLRFYEDLSEREAAEIVGCSVRALNQLVARATATLRQRFGKDER